MTERINSEISYVKQETTKGKDCIICENFLYTGSRCTSSIGFTYKLYIVGRYNRHSEQSEKFDNSCKANTIITKSFFGSKLQFKITILILD